MKVQGGGWLGWGSHSELEVPLRHPREDVERAAEYMDGELWGEVQAGAVNV